MFNTAEVKRFVGVLLDESGTEYTAYCPGKGYESLTLLSTICDALLCGRSRARAALLH